MTGNCTAAPAIRLENLGRTYTVKTANGQTSERTALKGVTLSIASGELFGLLGPNGAGKTTLIKILSTMLLPSSGSVHLLGLDVVNQAWDVRKHIGVVLGGERGLYYRLSARDILGYWASMYGVHGKRARNRVEELLDLVGLGSRANDRVETFSRGMKQRLHLARGLIGSPKVLFLDEPTSGLDPSASESFHGVIMSLQRGGVTILLATHDMREAEVLCDRVAFINAGDIVLTDTPQALIRLSSTLEVIDAEFAGGMVSKSTLAAIPGVLKVEVLQTDGPLSLRLTLGGSDRVPDVLRELAHLGVSRVFSKVPTLHDLYLHLASGDGIAV